MFPAPGKTREDYEEEYVRIQNLIAADVMAEHYGHDGEDDLSEVLSPGQVQEAEVIRRTHPCDTCDAKPGDPCVTKKGTVTKSHNSRYKKAKMPL
jgi:hypothetical protein